MISALEDCNDLRGVISATWSKASPIGINSTEIAHHPETIRRMRDGRLLGRALEGQRPRADYKKYADLAPAIIGKFGGKFLARGGKFKILEGPEKFHRFVVIEFPSLERAVACHELARVPRQPRRIARRTAPASSRSLIVESV